MKTAKYTYTKEWFILGLILVIATSCERDYSDEVEFASFPQTGAIFTDTPVGLGSDFYFPYSGSKPTAWSVDTDESYKGIASMRFDVPNANDPEGNYAGAIFRIDGEGSGRNLTGFDALTFWAKASEAVTIAEFGFGEDFIDNRYITTRQSVQLTTNWVKYIIPIPDPDKLIQERGMLRYAASGVGLPGQESGYSFWIDELRFEKIGAIAQPSPAILNGNSQIQTGFVGGTFQIDGFSQTFNMADGSNLTVATTAAYFDFKSSDSNVAVVSDSGLVTIVGNGAAEITATIAGVTATGALTVSSEGDLIAAPIPTINASGVMSLYSDAYTDTAVSLISDFGSFQTSSLSTLSISGDEILNYQNVNFFGIEFNDNVGLPTIDASSFNTLHMDIYIGDLLPSGADLTISLRNIGPNNIIETNEFTGQPIGDDTEISITPSLISDQWISVDFDISSLIDRSALGQIVFVSPASGPNSFYVDNIYFHN